MLLLLYFTSLCITLHHFTSLYFTLLYFTLLHFTSLHFTSLHLFMDKDRCGHNMLCEISESYGFITVWTVLTILGFISMMILSSIVFIPLYVKVNYETWCFKCNPRFPSPSLIRKEIIHTIKGLVVATLVPAFTLYASAPSRAYSKGYCGNPYKLDGIGWVRSMLILACSSMLILACIHIYSYMHILISVYVHAYILLYTHKFMHTYTHI